MRFSLPFSFELSTRIDFGENSLLRLPAALAPLGRRVLIVTDRGITGLPWFEDLRLQLLENGFPFRIFDGVEANPKDRDAEAAGEAARSFSAECLLAVGGGSPIDCAKAAAVLALQEGRARDYEDSSRIGEKVLPVVAVPTTAGTGSEVTLSSVITDTREKFKYTIKSPKIAPRTALLDPILTISMPPALTAATGMDALTHAIEAFSSRASNPVSDACALYAAELIAGNLVKAYELGNDREARAAVLLGSVLAGIAFSRSDVGAVHCIAEALGGMYDIPHGICNAVTLPAVMERCAEDAGDRYARLARAMGAEEESAGGAVDFVHELSRRVELPSFAGFGIPVEDFEIIAAKSEANGSNRDNLPMLARDDYLQILKSLSV